jgi:hypothetical protein
MRLSALLWPFSFGVRLGWATARMPNPDVDRARGRVFLLRGNGVVFSRGFGDLCAALRRAGVWAVYLTRPRLYPARPLRRAAGSPTLVENIDLDAAGSPVDARGLHHLNITASPAVQALVLGRVLEAVGPGAARTPG